MISFQYGIAQIRCIPSPLPDEIENQIVKNNQLYLEGRFSECVISYNVIVSKHPDYCVGYYNRGLAKYYSGDKEGAKIDFEKARSLGMDDAQTTITRLFPIAECLPSIKKTESKTNRIQNGFFKIIAVALTCFALIDIVHAP